MSISAGIPKRFNELLEKKGYDKPSDFVKQTGMPKTTVYGLAKGKTSPRVDAIEMICDKLGVLVTLICPFLFSRRWDICHVTGFHHIRLFVSVKPDAPLKINAAFL